VTTGRLNAKAAIMVWRMTRGRREQIGSMNPIRENEFPVPSKKFPVLAKKFPVPGASGNWGASL
jgi:hypothetical protein